jgi:hypothetical protein
MPKKTKSTIIFDQTTSVTAPETVDTISDDYILDSLTLLPQKESLRDVEVPPDQRSNRPDAIIRTVDTPMLSDNDIRKAQKEVQTETIKKQERAKQTMEDIIGKTPRVLFNCSAVFPFDFFPDEISIEETRVNIIQRAFLASAEIKSVGIEDISEVAVSTTIVFATLRIAARSFIDNMVEIQFLRKQDAMKARRIIEGLRILHGEKVDLSTLDLSQLVTKVEEIGAFQKPQ